jgi:hypothetical protein
MIGRAQRTERIHRSMLAMAAIAVSTRSVASAQYTFVKLKSEIPTGIGNNNEIVGIYQWHEEGGLKTYGWLLSNVQSPAWTYLVDLQRRQ